MIRTSTSVVPKRLICKESSYSRRRSLSCAVHGSGMVSIKNPLVLVNGYRHSSNGSLTEATRFLNKQSPGLVSLSRRWSSSDGSSKLVRSEASSPLQKQSSDGVLARPINFDAASQISGAESQILTVDLEPGQVLRAESGAMLYMTEGVKMETTMGGGLSAGFKRMLTGQNLMISDFSYEGERKGQVALGTDFPSKIMRLNLEEYGGKIVCQKGALLCASHTVDIEMEFTKKFSAGFFGGEGFVLQALTGEGDVFVKAGGALIRRDLREGETLRISSGCLVAFSEGVEYDIQMMPGFKNVVFGGEGLFVTTLTGPGTIWLQGQPPERMISEIARRVPSGGVGFGVPIMMGGGGEGGETGADSADEVDGGDAESLTGAAAAESAVESDRASAMAESTVGGPIDSESPSALFGDAAEQEAPSTSSAEPSYESDPFSTSDEFSAEESPSFDDDQTTFTTHEEQVPEVETAGGEEGGGVMSTLWGLFSDDD